MNQVLSVGGRLALICVVAALVLGLVNAVTEPAIAAAKERRLQEALDAVTAGKEVGEYREVSDTESGQVNGYYPLNEDGAGGQVSGYVVKLTGVGYGGDMEILASYDPDGEISAVSLMDNQETPGLGKMAEKPEYMEKFIGTGDDEPIPTTKQQLSQKQADAITGATITFMGIAQALKAGEEFLDDLGD